MRASAADRPGIYRMLSSTGEVVYVGKSKRVRTRLLSYFRCAYPEEKGARILREAETIDWEYTPSEFAALLQELRLIKHVPPATERRDEARCDCTTRSSRSRRGAAPKLTVVRGASADDASVYYGPFVGAQRIEEALRELSDALMLRDCKSDMKMHFSDQQELFQLSPRTPGCIRYEIGKCLGPCVGGCSVCRVRRACRAWRAHFSMDRATGPSRCFADRWRSERESRVRARRVVSRQARRDSKCCASSSAGCASLSRSFPSSTPSRDTKARTASTSSSAESCGQSSTSRAHHGSGQKLKRLAEDIFSTKEKPPTSVPTHEIDELLLLSSWFRRFPAEMGRTRKSPSFLALAGVDARRRQA